MIIDLVVGVAGVQGLEGDLVVQDGLDAIVIGNKLKTILYFIVLDIKQKSYLRQEGNFTHWIVETANFELADLEIEEVFSPEKCLFYKTNCLENNNDNGSCFIFSLLNLTTSPYHGKLYQYS